MFYHAAAGDAKPSPMPEPQPSADAPQVAPDPSILPGHPPPILPCPSCWRTAAGCHVTGDIAVCLHRRWGDADVRVGSDGTSRYIYQVSPEPVRRFLAALFQPGDKVLQRQIETWTAAGNKQKRKQSRTIPWSTMHRRAADIARMACLWQVEVEMAAQERGNQFFGVCPRFRGRDGQTSWDHACQIRVVRTLWADIDHCAAEEALARCEAAGLPRPTAAVSSGNGAHLYWRLAEPWLIDDVGAPPPIQYEVQKSSDGREWRVPYYVDPAGNRVNQPFALSGKAVHMQAVLAAIARRIGGDHTIDLARLLRLPETLNRKDQRNGKRPVPCVLVECDPARRYPMSLFEALAATPVAEAGSARDVDVNNASLADAGHHVGAVANSASPAASDLNDSQLIERAMAAKNGAQFAALWLGDTSGYGGDHSSADLALCGMLAFWAGPDAGRIDRLFRQSGLYRQKWDRPDYRAATIRRALAGRSEHYRPATREHLPDLSLAQILDQIELPPEVPARLPGASGTPSERPSAPGNAPASTRMDQSPAGANSSAPSAALDRQTQPSDLAPATETDPASTSASATCRRFSLVVEGTLTTTPLASHEKNGDTPAPKTLQERRLRAEEQREQRNKRLFARTRVLEGYDGRPCPARQWVQLGRREQRERGLGLDLRCRRWSCVVCVRFQRTLWREHLAECLQAEPGPLYHWDGPARRWPAIQRQIQRLDGTYCRVAKARGRVLVVATVAAEGFIEVARDAAIDSVDTAVAMIRRRAETKAKRAGKRSPTPHPVSASRRWALPDCKSGMWRRLAVFQDPERSIRVLRALGVRVVHDPDDQLCRSASGIQGQADCSYPRNWDETQISWANVWASMMTLPPGWPEGTPPPGSTRGAPPPDPGPLVDEVWCGTVDEFWDGLLPSVLPPASMAGSDAPSPVSAPTPAPAHSAAPVPEARQPCFAFARSRDIKLDASGRWRVVEVEPSGYVTRRSRRAYASRRMRWLRWTASTTGWRLKGLILRRSRWHRSAKDARIDRRRTPLWPRMWCRSSRQLAQSWPAGTTGACTPCRPPRARNPRGTASAHQCWRRHPGTPAGLATQQGPVANALAGPPWPLFICRAGQPT